MIRKKILIVDSIGGFIEKEKGILDREGCILFSAKSGEEALSIHRKEQVDLIITGLDTKGMNGNALCAALRNDRELKQVSIIIVCANTTSDLTRASQCKANACVTRPIEPLKLLSEVSRLLDIPERKSYRVILKVTVDGRTGTESFFCSSRNISVSGILIETGRSLENGDRITCSFFLPKSERITVEGEIVRVVRNADTSSQYGIRYADLRPDYRSAIEAFVGRRPEATPHDVKA